MLVLQIMREKNPWLNENNTEKKVTDYTSLTDTDVKKIIAELSPDEQRLLELTRIMNEEKPK